MKLNLWTLLVIGSVFLFQFIHADTERSSLAVVAKRSVMEEKAVLVKRCKNGDHDGVLDLDCVLTSVVDLLESILGGHDHHHHYNDHETEQVGKLLRLVRKLLHTLGLNHRGDLDLDDVLGELLGGHHNDDDDFGCGCDGDSDALIDHLIVTIEHLLHELADCRDGLIPQLVEAVTELLGGCREEHRRHHLDKREMAKRCEHHDGDGLLGLDCLLDSVVDLIESILGGHGHDDHEHHYDHDSTDLVEQLVRLVRKLLDVLGLNHHGGLDLDGVLGGLLGHGDHDHGDFGCGCDDNHDALVSYLVELIKNLLKQLAGCKDGKSGLIPRLIEVVTDLLEDLLHNHHGDEGEHHGVEGEHHGDEGEHHGGKGEHHGGKGEHHGGKGEHHGEHHGGCGNSLGLDCLLDSVIDLVDSLLGGHGHHHEHGDDKVSGLVDELLRVVRHLLGALDLDGGLKLDGIIGIGHHDNDDDFGCDCNGDHDSLITYLIETVEHLLEELGGCEDNSGLIAQLIKAVRQILRSVDRSRGDHELRKRFALRKRSTFGRRNEDALDVDLLCGVLETIQDLLNQILGECGHGDFDHDLLESVRALVRRILKGVKEILNCLTGGKFGGLNHLVSSLVKDVCALLECLNGREHHDSDGLDDLLDSLVEVVTSLVNGCRLARLIDLDGLVVLH